jgi:hypothetical protein
VLDDFPRDAESEMDKRLLIVRQRAQDAMSGEIEGAGSIRDFKVVRVALNAI